jgi:hypothetical protein
MTTAELDERDTDTTEWTEEEAESYGLCGFTTEHLLYVLREARAGRDWDGQPGDPELMDKLRVANTIELLRRGVPVPVILGDGHDG